MISLRSSLLTAACISCAVPVYATEYAVGDLGLTPYISQVVVKGAFEDFYDFSIAPPGGSLSASAFTLNLPVPKPLSGNLLNIADFAARLIDAASNPIATLAFDTTTNNYVVTQPLTPGAYRIDVTGTGNGLSGGFYALSLVAATNSVSAVPEPATVATLLTGLGLVALLAMRRASRARAAVVRARPSGYANRRTPRQG